jgi:hypothetical protein
MLYGMLVCINSRLTEHLHRCSGNAVVVFDEVQKVIPHTLDGERSVSLFGLIYTS